MPIAPSQTYSGGIGGSKAGALNPRLSTSMVLSVDVASIEADGSGSEITLSAAISKAFHAKRIPGPVPDPEHTAPAGYPHDWHEWAPGYEPQPGYEQQPTGSGKVTFYNTGLGTALKSITDNTVTITTVEPHGFTAGMHIGIWKAVPGPIVFDPVDAVIIEADGDTFTYDARPLGEDGPDVPDQEEADFPGTAMPVLGSGDIDTTQTWDNDAPAFASPAVDVTLTLPIGAALSDDWTTNVLGPLLYKFTAYYSGTVDWNPCIGTAVIFWPYALQASDVSTYLSGWTNPRLVGKYLVPPDIGTGPPVLHDGLIAYPRTWAIEGPGTRVVCLTVPEGGPATFSVAQAGTGGVFIGSKGGVFIKSDDYPDNPVGEYEATGDANGQETAIGAGSVAHITQPEPWTYHASDLSELIPDWPDPAWHNGAMGAFPSNWFPRIDADSDYTGYIAKGSPCSLQVQRGSATDDTAIYGEFIRSGSGDLTNPVGEYTCDGLAPDGWTGTVLAAGGVIHVAAG